MFNFFLLIFEDVLKVYNFYTYQLHFIPEGVAEASQIFLRYQRFTKMT
jgi:hypothetical protein